MQNGKKADLRLKVTRTTKANNFIRLTGEHERFLVVYQMLMLRSKLAG